MSNQDKPRGYQWLDTGHFRKTLPGGAIESEWHALYARQVPPVAEQDKPVACGHDSRILHELAGAASLCWEPKPTGVFDTQKAIGFVEDALKELRASCAPPVALTDEELADCGLLSELSPPVAEPEDSGPLLDDEGRAMTGVSHHYTVENMRAMVAEMRRLADPEQTSLQELDAKDWRGRCNVWGRVMAGLLEDVPPAAEFPALPVAEAFSLTRSIYTADDMRGYARTAVAVDRAARVPVLTDEQIDKELANFGLWTLVLMVPQNKALLYGFARAVLAAAHGSKP